MSGVNVTWRRIRARSDPVLLISEVDLDGFVLAAVVRFSDANDKLFVALVVCHAS